MSKKEKKAPQPKTITLKGQGGHKGVWTLFQNSDGIILQRDDESEQHLISHEEKHSKLRYFSFFGVEPTLQAHIPTLAQFHIPTEHVKAVKEMLGKPPAAMLESAIDNATKGSLPIGIIMVALGEIAWDGSVSSFVFLCAGGLLLIAWSLAKRRIDARILFLNMAWFLTMGGLDLYRIVSGTGGWLNYVLLIIMPTAAVYTFNEYRRFKDIPPYPRGEKPPTLPEPS